MTTSYAQIVNPQPKNPSPMDCLGTELGQEMASDMLGMLYTSCGYWAEESEEIEKALENFTAEDVVRGLNLVADGIFAGDITNRYVVEAVKEFYFGNYDASFMDVVAIDIVVQRALFGKLMFN